MVETGRVKQAGARITLIDWNEVLGSPENLMTIRGLLRNDKTDMGVQRPEGGEDASPVLERLIRMGVVELQNRSRVIACPNPESSSTDVEIRVRCASCKSQSITKREVLQHRCGNVGEFTLGDSCSHCGQELDAKTTKKQGTLWRCDNCSASALENREPSFVFYCRQHKDEFERGQEKLVEIGSYALSDAATEELRDGRPGLLIRFADTARESGLEPRINGTLRGRAGADLHFDMVLVSGGMQTPVGIIAGGGNEGAQETLNMCGKVLDAKPASSFIIAVPSATEEMKMMANSCGIRLLEGEDLKKIADVIAATLR